MVHYSDALPDSAETVGLGLRYISAVEMTILNALAQLAASTSTRWQGEVLIALSRFGISMTRDEVLVVLDRLERAGLIGPIIELEDGGIITTLTRLALFELDMDRRVARHS